MLSPWANSPNGSQTFPGKVKKGRSMSVQTPLVQSFNNAQAQLVVQTADLPLGTLAGMVEANAINLEPGFQRRERWTPDKQSALIESFLLNVPVPPVYLGPAKR